MNIQWYPGHMTKTRRQMEADLRLVDAICEIIDARIPISSRNPDIDSIIKNKPRLLVLNRVDQADPAVTKQWRAYFESRGIKVMETDCSSGKGVSAFGSQVRALLEDKLQKRAELGQKGRMIRVMIMGVPNVGKSAFINRVARRKAAKAEDRAGVTRGKQWASVDNGLELLDTPGILWPKFDDPQVGLRLAWTGAVRDAVTDPEELASLLLELLSKDYPEALENRYGIKAEEDEAGWQLLEKAARKRGFLVRGGDVDSLRMANILLDEFRGGKLGRLSLETPPTDEQEQTDADA